MWSAARLRGYSLADIVRWMAERPAALAGLPHKGRLAVGGDAELRASLPPMRNSSSIQPGSTTATR